MDKKIEGGRLISPSTNTKKEDIQCVTISGVTACINKDKFTKKIGTKTKTKLSYKQKKISKQKKTFFNKALEKYKKRQRNKELTTQLKQQYNERTQIIKYKKPKTQPNTLNVDPKPFIKNMSQNSNLPPPPLAMSLKNLSKKLIILFKKYNELNDIVEPDLISIRDIVAYKCLAVISMLCYSILNRLTEKSNTKTKKIIISKENESILNELFSELYKFLKNVSDKKQLYNKQELIQINELIYGLLNMLKTIFTSIGIFQDTTQKDIEALKNKYENKINELNKKVQVILKLALDPTSQEQTLNELVKTVNNRIFYAIYF